MFKQKYITLNQVNIYGRALKANYAYFQSLHPKKHIAPVLKSNAYGHGLATVGPWIAKHIDPPFVCVDSLFEAYELKKAGVKTKIIIMGYTAPDNFKVWRKLHQFHFPVYDLKTAQALNKHQPGVNAHIKIDTGMCRLGILPGQIADFAKQLKKLDKIRVTGIYSHLSQADEEKNQRFTQKQLAAFDNAVSVFKNAGFNFTFKHLLATSAASYLKGEGTNLIRLGLGFYGISPFQNDSKYHKSIVKRLKPSLSVSTHLAQTKYIPQGSKVSYGGTFETQKDTKIGILPLGYYDGIDRRLSNRGVVRIGDSTCPIIGRVCMNITIIDLTHAPEAKIGDRVEVFSANTNAPNSIYHTAQLADTIPYTQLVNLSETTRRVLVE